MDGSTYIQQWVVPLSNYLPLQPVELKKIKTTQPRCKGLNVTLRLPLFTLIVTDLSDLANEHPFCTAKLLVILPD